MDFGKLADISNVDFKLPAVADGTSEFLSNLPKRQGKPKIFVGPTGYAMPQWVGKTYPEKSRSKDFLRYYSQQFNTVEHNTTFYRIPDIESINKWKNDTAQDFKFCPKVPQSISHVKDLGVNGTDLPLFLQNIEMLEEKLGSSFIQLPPQFSVKSIGLLERFFEAWNSTIPLAVEVRHPSFFSDEIGNTSFFDTLSYYKKGAVITDVAGRRDILHQKLTLEKVIIRFVGNGLHLTDYQRINAWVSRLKEWFEWGLHEVFFFIHQPDNLLAPELTLYLTEEIKKAFESEIRGPVFFNTSLQQDKQMKLF
ncbi:MAG: DUF72 domain-containing protein [Saprospiraceae bacterium]